MLYHFKGIKPRSKFWANLKGFMPWSGEGALIPYSAFTTDRKRGAITAVKLAKH